MDEIVICRVKALVTSSESNGTTKEGFILFIKGQYYNIDDSDDSTINNNTDDIELNTTASDDTTYDSTINDITNSTQNDLNSSSVTPNDSSTNENISTPVNVIDDMYFDSNLPKESRVAKIYREFFTTHCS